jgi:hypothetical protein
LFVAGLSYVTFSKGILRVKIDTRQGREWCQSP